jgi:hypothetical protein
MIQKVALQISLALDNAAAGETPAAGGARQIVSGSRRASTGRSMWMPAPDGRAGTGRYRMWREATVMLKPGESQARSERTDLATETVRQNRPADDAAGTGSA